jgi:chaperone modulatory protein CbpM
MKDYFSEDEVIITVTRLTRNQLVRFMEFELVKPQQADVGFIFRPIDIARLELLCDLSQDLDLDESALGVVISLLDQLHTARNELAILSRAIESLPSDLRSSIQIALQTR